MKKLLPVILGVVLIGGGFFAYTKFMGGGPKEPPVKAQALAEKKLADTKKQRRKDKIDGPTVSAGDAFVVNLADPGVQSFTKFALSLKVDKGTPVEAPKEGSDSGPALEEQPEIRDIVIDVVGDHSADELKTSAGRAAVKDELIEAINTRTPKTVVLDVYFTDFAIQQAS